MTPEEQERERLRDLIWAHMDDANEGESLTAFGKARGLKEKMGGPGFADILRERNAAAPKLEAAAQNLAAAEKSRAEWKLAHDKLAAANTNLLKENSALKARILALRAVKGSLSLKRLAASMVVLAVGYGGWHWSNADANPSTTAVIDEHIENGLRDALKQTKWAEGDTTPAAWRINSTHWWIVARGYRDSATHADAHGKLIERHCIKIFAREAVADAGAYLTPNPYALFGAWTKWPESAAVCRMPGEWGYS
jgi:hypothetical protein